MFKSILITLLLFVSTNLSAYSLALNLSNPTNSPVSFTIQRGRVFTPSDQSSGVQALSVARDVRVTIPANTLSYRVNVPALCISANYSSPSGQSFLGSPLRLNPALRRMNQTQVWAAFGFQQ